MCVRQTIYSQMLCSVVVDASVVAVVVVRVVVVVVVDVGGGGGDELSAREAVVLSIFGS